MEEKKTPKKTKKRYPRFEMVMSEEEKDLFKETAKKQGFNSLAKFFRASAEASIRNPVRVQETEPQPQEESAKILESVQEYFSIFEDIFNALKSVTDEQRKQAVRLDVLDNKITLLMEKEEIPAEKIKQAEQAELEGEEVFEDD